MPWLKLTSKSLYLMEGDKYLDKVDLQKRSNPAERSLNIPLGWFGASDAPNGMVIGLKGAIEPRPIPPAAIPYFNLAAIPNPWQLASKQHIPTLAKAFKDQGIHDYRVLAYAAATIGRESSWRPTVVNTTDAAAKTGYPGAGLAQVTWKSNYQKVSEMTKIDFVGNPKMMFDPYSSLRAKAAFYQFNNMTPYIQAGDYQSAAGIYNAGNARFRSSYTRNVAADVTIWIPVFKQP